MSTTPDTAIFGFGWVEQGGNYSLVKKNNSVNYETVMSINRTTGNISFTGQVNADNDDNDNASFVANGYLTNTIGIGGWYGASHTTEHRITGSTNLHLDSADSGHIYLNLYSGQNVYIGNDLLTTGDVIFTNCCTKGSKDSAMNLAWNSNQGNGTVSFGMGTGNVENFIYFFSKNQSGNNVFGTLQLPTSGSDDRRKHNEVPINNALENIMKLRPEKYDKTFDFKDEHYNGELAAGTFIKEAGLIAQDVYDIEEFREYVTVGDETTSWELHYNSLFTYGIKAIQELNIENEGLKTRVIELETELAAEKIKISTLETQLADVLSRLSVLENN